MLKRYISEQGENFQRVGIVLAGLAVAAIGTLLLTGSHAASPYASTTADKGVVANGATKQACAGASDATCVQFGSTLGGSTAYGTPANPFAALADVNTPIPSNTSYTNFGVMNVYTDITDYGFPIYTATASTPRIALKCNLYCPSTNVLNSVPWPAGMLASPGSDGAAAILDTTNGISYELWQTNISGKSVNGAGVAHWQSSDIAEYDGSGTGPDISSVAGTVSMADLAAGVIPHALNFSTSFTCSTFVPPATGSDGHGSGSGCLPEGTRIQLDPSTSLSGLTPFQKMVGQALITYGAYVGDTGGASMAIRFEDPVDTTATGQSNWYAANGISDNTSFPSNWSFRIVPDVHG